jgi:hypothetical protein
LEGSCRVLGWMASWFTNQSGDEGDKRGLAPALGIARDKDAPAHFAVG